MAKSEDYTLVDLLAIGMATVDSDAIRSKDGHLAPGPGAHDRAMRLLAKANQENLVKVGWVSESDTLYTDGQKADNPHVRLRPVFKVRNNR
jgi:hypothetical protein